MPCVHTYAVVPTLVVAGAALGASPVHRAQPPAIGGFVADPAPQDTKPLDTIENQCLLLE